MPCPRDVPRCGASRSIACEDGRGVGRGDLDGQAAVAERDDADRDALRLVRHEGLGGRLGRIHARRLEVRRGHAAGHVEREDHGALEPRQADHRLGPREGDDITEKPSDESAAGTRRRQPSGRPVAVWAMPRLPSFATRARRAARSARATSTPIGTRTRSERAGAAR